VAVDRGADELVVIAPPAYSRARCGIKAPDGGGMLKCQMPDREDAYASCQV
jgi:hypothetical protein